eukprot:TRINITY_DN4145_c0_g1_i1.p1 TRINITY_DN4145_c0_g1~~TRINITY_DN4145_c0_g1_i1.p1  ORF type:complete len:1512 (-),score=326.72 TRINITY_DN4145_c0_g1_i1:375-4688(-)
MAARTTVDGGSGLCALAVPKGPPTVTAQHETGALGPFPSDEDERILTVKSAAFYRPSLIREAAWWLSVFLTGGILHVVMSWLPRLKATLRYKRVDCDDTDAQVVVIQAADGIFEIVDIHELKDSSSTEEDGGAGYSAWGDVSHATGSKTPDGWSGGRRKATGTGSDSDKACVAVTRQRSTSDGAADNTIMGSSPGNELHDGTSSVPTAKLLSGRHDQASPGSPGENAVDGRRETYKPTMAGGQSGQQAPKLRMFYWRYERFFALPGVPGWTRLSFGLSGRGPTELHRIAARQLQATMGQHSSVVVSNATRRRTFGQNLVDIKVDSLGTIVALAVTTPFFCFQLFSMFTWLAEGYRIYAYVIIWITALSLVQEALQVRKNQRSLQRIAGTQVPVERAVVCMSQVTHTHTNAAAALVGVQSVVQSGVQPAFSLAFETVMSADLMPGDVIRVRTGEQCPCDLVLLAGQLVVSEAMLTGESAPVVKYSLPLEPVSGSPPGFDVTKHSKHLLLSGTLVLQAKPPGHPPVGWDEPGRQSVWHLLQTNNGDIAAQEEYPVLSLVVGTGASTAKGRLIRAIKHPQSKTSHADEQEKDSMAFLLVLFVIVLIFVAWYAIYAGVRQHQSAGKIVLRCMDIVTIMVPAALPLALTIGASAALQRLMQRGIFCTAPDHIVSAGHVDTICYDKTGTLTREGDTLVGIIPAQSHSLKVAQSLPDMAAWGLTKDVGGDMAHVMSACHSLEPLESTGCLVGESLELEMFGATGWQQVQRPSRQDRMAGSHFQQLLNSSPMGPQVPNFAQSIVTPPEGDKLHYPLAVVHLYPFDADTRLMSVLTLPLLPDTNPQCDPQTPDLLLVTKGAPESVIKACDKATVPAGHQARLSDMAAQGYRVLACATKVLRGIDATRASHLQQAALETGMAFAGFLVMGNQVKAQTGAVLQAVTRAGVRQCMITGDNVLTAVAVARDSAESNMWQSGKAACFIDRSSDTSLTGAAACTVLSGAALAGATGAGSEGESSPNGHDLQRRSLAQALSAGGEAWLMEVNVAITGAAISELYEEHLTRCQGKEDWPTNVYSPDFNAGTGSALVLLIKHTNVYARAAPREKQLIVRCLQGLGHVVCMVGDGANDSFALKSADAGLSIAGHERDPSESAAEDTLAVPSIAAPFSTPIAHIGAVPLLLCEGRCALATSLVSFRYMFQYGVTQFMATSLLYVHLSTLSAWQFLIADLVNTLPLVMVLNLTASADHLQAGLPFTKLGSWRFVGALTGNCAIICLGQVLQFLALRAQSFYDPLSAKEGSQGDPSQEDTMLFLSSTFMYLTQAIALCHDYGGFRASATTNKPLVAIVLVLFTFNSALFLAPTAAAQSWLQMVDTIPWWFLFVSWLWALVCGAALVAFEHFCVVKREGFWFERQRQQTAGGKLLSSHLPFTKPATISATPGSSPRYTLV